MKVYIVWWLDDEKTMEDIFTTIDAAEKYVKENNPSVFHYWIEEREVKE